MTPIAIILLKVAAFSLILSGIIACLILMDLKMWLVFACIPFIIVTPWVVALNFEEPRSFGAKVLAAICAFTWFAPNWLTP